MDRAAGRQPAGREDRAWRRGGVRLLAVALASLAVGASGIAPTTAAPRASSKEAVTFGVEPATAHGPSGLPHFSFGGTVGATLTDHVAVLNYSAKPLSLQLYATDAVNTAAGGFGLLPATSTPVGAGAWITLPLKSATVRVPAQTAKAPGIVVVPFTLKVPANATPGDHVGGIVASLRTEGHNASGQDIILEQRVGTRVFVRIAGGTLVPKLTLSDLHGTFSGTLNPIGKGGVTVAYQVTNTGNVELALNQGVTISGLFGTSRHVALANVPLLLPGDSLTETAKVSGVWPQFTAKATVTAVPVGVAGDSDPQLVSVTASTRLWAVPWALLAFVVVVVVLALAGVGLRSRNRRSRQPEHADPVSQRVNA